MQTEWKWASSVRIEGIIIVIPILIRRIIGCKQNEYVWKMHVSQSQSSHEKHRTKLKQKLTLSVFRVFQIDVERMNIHLKSTAMAATKSACYS